MIEELGEIILGNKHISTSYSNLCLELKIPNHKLSDSYNVPNMSVKVNIVSMSQQLINF